MTKSKQKSLDKMISRRFPRQVTHEGTPATLIGSETSLARRRLNPAPYEMIPPVFGDGKIVPERVDG